MTTLSYRGYTIERIGTYRGREEWEFRADDYDGPEDRRAGHAHSAEDCKAEIDCLIEDLGDGRPPKPAGTYDIATVLAMVRYELCPGDADLDAEQPMAIRVGARHFHVPLRDIRLAHELAGVRADG